MYIMHERLRKLAVILLVLTSLYSMFLHWRSTMNMDRGSAALESWDAEFQIVREALPVESGTIGFVSDWDVPGIEYDFGDQETEYILTQYALAPLVLVKGPVAEWNVGILSREALKIWKETNKGKFEVIPIRKNIYLLKRVGE